MKLARPPEKYDAGDQARMRGEIERADDNSLKRTEAAPYLLLSATDNGSTMKVTVTSAGVFSATLVAR
jgi:hypothetical protein